MRAARCIALLVLLSHAATARAMLPEPPRPETPSTPPVPTASAPALTPRQQAERLYADAYEDVARAKQDTDAGHERAAVKRFRRALERAGRATALDTTYHEAWNLAGYAARRLGDYPRALEAYARCLRLAPGYAPAREYLGEAHVERGDLAAAREQLGWLERVGTPEQAAALRAKIEAKAAAGTAGGR